MATLVLLRHGESQWNLENRFTGWIDIPLSPKGEAEARAAGETLKARGLHFDAAFTSVLQRANRTLALALEVLGQPGLVAERNQALNERHYGDLQGLNKAETAAKFGDAQVHIWRRSYDIPPPNGESLKETAARTLPYFETKILPLLKAGKSVIIGAHGNSLRSIIMSIEGLTPEEIVEVNLATGVPVVYDVAKDGSVSPFQFKASA